jgi:hypothetical protein
LNVFLSIFFLLVPAIKSTLYIHELTQNPEKTPKFVFEHHYALTQKYEQWLDQKLDSSSTVAVQGVADTEWPLFGTVFYLWTTEELQKQWLLDRSSAKFILSNVIYKWTVKLSNYIW